MRRQLHIFPTFAMGGAQRRFITLASALRGKWEHMIVSLNGDMTALAAIPPNVQHDVEQLALSKGRGISPRNVLRIRRLFQKIQPDILCTYNWGSIEAAFACFGLPNVSHVHFEDGFGPDEVHGLSPVRNLCRRLAFLGKAKVVVPSTGLSYIAKTAWGVGHKKLHHVPNGVDTDLFKPDPTEQDRVPTIGFIGALRAEKNPSLFLDVVRACSGAQALIVGDGEEGEGLKVRAAAERLPVAFAGSVDDPSEYYRQLDLFLLTSDTEQMPLSVLEAMASGLPVVSTDVGDVRMMVSEENAPYIVKSSDVLGLSNAVQYLLENPSLGQQIGKANRQKVIARYSEATMIDAYRMLFDEA